MGEAIGAIILGTLAMFSALSPIFLSASIYKIFHMSRIYKNKKYRDKKIEEGLSTLQAKYERYTLAVDAFQEKEKEAQAVLKQKLSISNDDDTKQKKRINKEIEKRLSVDALLLKKVEMEYKHEATKLYMSYALIYNTFYKKRQTVLDVTGDRVTDKQRKKIEKYNAYMQEAEESIDMLIKQHKLSAKPHKYSNAWAIQEGYDKKKIDSVFPIYFGSIEFDYTGLFVLEYPSTTIRWAILYFIIGLGFYSFQLF